MAVTKSSQPSLENSPLYWSAGRCQNYLLDNGVWVGDWPIDCETALDCLRTLRAACAHFSYGTSPAEVVGYIVRNCELSAEVVA